VLESRLEIQLFVGPGNEMTKDSGLRGLPGIYRFLSVFGGMLEGFHSIRPNTGHEGCFVGADVVL